MKIGFFGLGKKKRGMIKKWMLDEYGVVVSDPSQSLIVAVVEKPVDENVSELYGIQSKKKVKS